MKDILISAKNLKKEFRTGETNQTIFENLELDIYKGDFTIIMGASGAGKSSIICVSDDFCICADNSKSYNQHFTYKTYQENIGLRLN